MDAIATEELLFASGQHLEQEFGSATVKFHVAQLIEQQELDPAVADDRLRQLLPISSLNELVDQLRGQDVADQVSGLLRGMPKANDQVGLAFPAVADQAKRCPFYSSLAHVMPFGQLSDRQPLDPPIPP